MKTPDLTPAQIKADVALVLGVVSAVGLNIDGQLSGLITAAVIAAFALAHLAQYFADAKLRGARARNAYEIGQAKLEELAADPVATADKLTAILSGIEKAIDAGTAAQSVKIPVTETSKISAGFPPSGGVIG